MTLPEGIQTTMPLAEDTSKPNIPRVAGWLSFLSVVAMVLLVVFGPQGHENLKRYFEGRLTPKQQEARFDQVIEQKVHPDSEAVEVWIPEEVNDKKARGLVVARWKRKGWAFKEESVPGRFGERTRLGLLRQPSLENGIFAATMIITAKGNRTPTLSEQKNWLRKLAEQNPMRQDYEGQVRYIVIPPQTSNQAIEEMLMEWSGKGLLVEKNVAGQLKIVR